MTQKRKTPAELTAGAACDVVDTRSSIASSNLHSTTEAQQKALARKQPETRAKFAEILITRGKTAHTGSRPGTAGATARNAWLPIEVLRG